MNETTESSSKEAQSAGLFLVPLVLSCHERLWKTKKPMTDHLLREDCGYELLCTKQLKQEQWAKVPRGGRMWAGPDEAVEWKWSAEVVTVCGISAPQILMDSGQVCAQYINTPRYISCQSLSICCLQKASMALKPQSPSGSFQVSSSRTSHTFPDMDLLSASAEGRVPGPLYSCGLLNLACPLTAARCKKWPQSDPS